MLLSEEPVPHSGGDVGARNGISREKRRHRGLYWGNVAHFYSRKVNLRQ